MPAANRTPPSASSQVETSGAPVIDIYARISRAVNGETVRVDDQIEMGSVWTDAVPMNAPAHA